MSQADIIFKDNCTDILENGTDTKGEKVRPHWDDGTPAYTIKKFGVVNRYDLSKEFPALTLRRTAIKSCVDELLWIYKLKSSNINELQSSIWDEWADENGWIGKAYGYQIGKPFIIKQVKDAFDLNDIWKKTKDYPSFEIKTNRINRSTDIYLDQMDNVLYQLKTNPFNRRILINMYNFEDLHAMHLQPCAYSLTFNVTQKPNEDRLTLNMILNQRSQDVLTANNWNVCQYAVLLHMIAQVSNMNVGELVHVIADAHIYDRHIPMVKELLNREPLPAPKFWINPEIKNFYDFTVDDIKLDNYKTHEQIKNIPVAI